MEYRWPVRAPINTRPPKTTGWDRVEVTSPRLKAHFNFSRGTSAAVSPAVLASAKRALDGPAPHPFQSGKSGFHTPGEPHAPAMGTGVPPVRLPTNSATA